MAELETPDPDIRVLVLEDDAALSEIVCEELRGRGHMAVAAGTVAEGRERLKELEFEVALLDLTLPDGTGIELLRQAVQEGLPTECIVLTGYATVATAIEAMKLGAYDYLTKPVRMEELDVLVRKAAEKSALRRENMTLRTRLERQDSRDGVVTEDPVMKALLDKIERVASSDLPVLIQGESGSGKELVARAVHRKSPRAGCPFVAVNCAAIQENLLESELFGYEKGAFTGAFTRKPGLVELAERGVLFLDEIGEVSAAVQPKLLRAVETHEFFRVGGTRPARADVRIVSATNKDLKNAIQAGTFREDLYFRLNGVTLQVPPLRERKADISLLAVHFLAKVGKQKLSHAALEKLEAYSWPGNVRELEMVMRRAAVLSSSETLEPEELPLDIRAEEWKLPQKSGLTLAELEQQYIESVLRENDGHRGKTAKALGIDVKTLYNKLGPEKRKG